MATEAEEIGFAGVLSGPLVRSSYRAGRLYKQAIEAREPPARRSERSLLTPARPPRLRLLTHHRRRQTGRGTTHGEEAPKAKKVKDPNKPGRIKQIRQSYTMTKETDPRIGLILLGVFLLAGLAGFAVMLLVFKAICLLGALRRPRRHPRGADHLRTARPAGRARPDRGQAGRGRGCARDAEARVEDRPRHRREQAAGPRHPGGRAPRHRADRRGQPQPTAPDA